MLLRLIVREIYDLCQDEKTELHVSISGRHKYMGFYVGYVGQNVICLVEKAFEQNREFFYPPTQLKMPKTHKLCWRICLLYA